MDLYLHTFGLRFNYEYNEQFDVFSFLELAASRGFAGVNISIFGPDYLWTSGIEPRQLARIRAKLEEHGLGVDVESNGTDGGSLLPLLEVATALGAKGVRTYATAGQVPEERCKIAIKDLKTAAAWAEDRGIPILFENHEDLSGAEVARILSEVDSPWVGALFDYGNAMCLGEEPLVALEALGPWVQTAHLKDQICAPGDQEGSANLVGVPVGCGDLPIRELTERLIALGVGRVCVENCWAYVAPVASWRGGATPGRGSFRFRSPSFPDDGAVVDHHQLSGQRLARAELSMLDTTIEGLDKTLSGLPVSSLRGF